MMRRGIRSSLRALPRRDRWHMLQARPQRRRERRSICAKQGKGKSPDLVVQEYAVGEMNQEEFRKLRVRDGQATLELARFIRTPQPKTRQSYEAHGNSERPGAYAARARGHDLGGIHNSHSEGYGLGTLDLLCQMLVGIWAHGKRQLASVRFRGGAAILGFRVSGFRAVSRVRG